MYQFSSLRKDDLKRRARNARMSAGKNTSKDWIAGWRSSTFWRHHPGL